MTRVEFERFRDLPGKTISGNITFLVKNNHPSLYAATLLAIANDLGLDARLEIHYDPDDESKIFTIHVASAGGPICRLCIDNGPHPPCMQSHKHALFTPDCPKNMLPLNVAGMPGLDGIGLAKAFRFFCETMNIEHLGTFHPPEVI